MKGNFEVTTTVKDWEPPFETKTEKKEYSVDLNEDFNEDANLDSYVFALVELKPDQAVVVFNTQYTLKQSQYASASASSSLVVGPGKIKIPKGTEIEFSYMWGHRGTTKKIKFTGTTK